MLCIAPRTIYVTFVAVFTLETVPDVCKLRSTESIPVQLTRTPWRSVCTGKLPNGTGVDVDGKSRWNVHVF